MATVNAHANSPPADQVRWSDLKHRSENGETFQTDKITTVPSGVYTDADLWQKEMDAVLLSK